ncbi:MAG TPA: histidine kinase [Terracidiphilus sp.]|nr:histidine kinase [Terracidiphilus sp.]
MVASSAQSARWLGASSAGERRFGRVLQIRRRLVRALLAAVGWTAVGCIFALPSMSTKGFHDELRIYLAQFWAWGLLAPVILAIDRRLPFSGKQLERRLLVHLALSLAFTEIYFYIFTAMRATMGVTPWSSLHFSQLFSPMVLGWQIWSWLVYWVIAGGVQAYGYYERYMNSELRLERLEHSFAEARLNSLRMQLDPHFLFNALNTISSHVERDPKLTRRMIEHLGDLLRLSLESKDKQEVPLFEEMAFLEHYLAIQKIRFGEQLKVEMQIEPDVRRALVPAFLIQPLVENAIRHGVSRRSSGGTVLVKATSLDDRLEIRVLDDGVGLPANWAMERAAGHGLSITRERIAGLHPNGASRFVVRNRRNGGTVAEVTLPLRVVGENGNGRPNA